MVFPVSLKTSRTAGSVSEIQCDPPWSFKARNLIWQAYAFRVQLQLKFFKKYTILDIFELSNLRT
jgi:hypothetical protein